MGVEDMHIVDSSILHSFYSTSYILNNFLDVSLFKHAKQMLLEAMH